MPPTHRQLLCNDKEDNSNYAQVPSVLVALNAYVREYRFKCTLMYRGILGVKCSLFGRVNQQIGRMIVYRDESRVVLVHLSSSIKGDWFSISKSCIKTGTVLEVGLIYYSLALNELLN